MTADRDCPGRCMLDGGGRAPGGGHALVAEHAGQKLLHGRQRVVRHGSRCRGSLCSAEHVKVCNNRYRLARSAFLG